MAITLPAALKKSMAASGGPAPVTLLEVLTYAQNLYTWSDSAVAAPPILYQAAGSGSGSGSGSGGGVHPVVIGRNPTFPTIGTPSGVLQFAPWIVSPPVFRQFKSTQTATATVAIQNLTGDSVRRDVAQLYASNELNSALVYFRLWRLDGECSVFDFQGNVDDAQIDAEGETMTLSIEGSYAWSKVAAPREQIGSTCGNIFNSGGCFYACGSVSPTPCTNSYGTCTSPNRFKGVVTEWVGSTINNPQVAQQAPLRQFNPKVPN